MSPSIKSLMVIHSMLEFDAFIQSVNVRPLTDRTSSARNVFLPVKVAKRAYVIRSPRLSTAIYLDRPVYTVSDRDSGKPGPFTQRPYHVKCVHTSKFALSLHYIIPVALEVDE